MNYLNDDSRFMSTIRYRISGTDIEWMCASKFSLDGRNVDLRGGSHDRGIDLAVSSTDGKRIEYIVQCKKYSTKKITTKDLAVLQSAPDLEPELCKDIDGKIYITTHLYTPDAIEKGKELGMILWNAETVKQKLSGAHTDLVLAQFIKLKMKHQKSKIKRNYVLQAKSIADRQNLIDIMRDNMNYEELQLFSISILQLIGYEIKNVDEQSEIDMIDVEVSKQFGKWNGTKGLARVFRETDQTDSYIHSGAIINFVQDVKN
eukprot:293233_1